MNPTCETCKHFERNLGNDKMPGFGRCAFLPQWNLRSAHSDCAFSPARHEPIEEPREPLELTA